MSRIVGITLIDLSTVSIEAFTLKAIKACAVVETGVVGTSGITVTCVSTDITFIDIDTGKVIVIKFIPIITGAIVCSVRVGARSIGVTGVDHFPGIVCHRVDRVTEELWWPGRISETVSFIACVVVNTVEAFIVVNALVCVAFFNVVSLVTQAPVAADGILADRIIITVVQLK